MFSQELKSHVVHDKLACRKGSIINTIVCIILEHCWLEWEVVESYPAILQRRVCSRCGEIEFRVVELV